MKTKLYIVVKRTDVMSPEAQIVPHLLAAQLVVLSAKSIRLGHRAISKYVN